jgi:tetratricopeptide (TPR) repeat protein
MLPRKTALGIGALGGELMRCTLLLPFIFFCASLMIPQIANGQMGKAVRIPSGSPEDKALRAIAAAPTNAEKLALLDKFSADFGKSDMEIVADEQYVAIYAGDKQYDKAFEYADKGLAADPDNYGIAYAAFRAAQDKGDVEREFRYGLALPAILARYKERPAPGDEDAQSWAAKKKDTLAQVAEEMNYVPGALLNAASKLQDPKRQTALLEPYSIAFADSPYAQPAQTLVADSYRRLRDYAKMTSFAQRVLEKDPNNISMLLLLADDGSDRGVNLSQADAYAHKALDLIPAAQKPDGVTDEQWAQRISEQKGIAWSAIGQAAIQKKNDAAALDAFQKAAPLLKGQPFLYARNQYRMGFALLNLKRTDEARTALSQAASADTPYRPLAQEKLNSLAAGGTKPAKKKTP